MAVQIKSVAPQATYDPALDGLRGLAVLMVLYGHTIFHYTKDLKRVFSGVEHSGVILFFVLSAFTLARSTENRLQRRERLLPDFYVRRFFRIFPLWWFFLTVSLILGVFLRIHHIHPTPEAIILNFLMLFGFVPGTNFTVIGWSLFVEETFYLVFPFVFLFVRSRRHTGASVLIAVALLAARVLWLGGRLTNEFLSNFPLAHFCAFALGLVAYDYKDRLRAGEWELGLLGAGYALCVAFGGYEAQAVASALLVWSVVQSQGVLRRLFSCGLLKRFGTCCFSVYLFHILVLKFLPRWRIWNSLLLSEISSFVCLAALSLGVAVITFTAIERSAVRWGQRVLGRLTPTGAR